MNKRELPRGSASSVLVAIALAGITAFAIASHPSQSRAAEQVKPSVSFASSRTPAPDVRPAAADKDTCDVQLD